MSVALVTVPLLHPTGLGRRAEVDIGWQHNCSGLSCVLSACKSGVGLGDVHYYRFGVNVRRSDRAGYDRKITQLLVSDVGARHGEKPRPFTALRIGIGNGGDDYVYVRQVGPDDLGRVLNLPTPVYIRPGYQKYVGVYADTNLPGRAQDDRGEKTGDCKPLMA